MSAETGNAQICGNFLFTKLFKSFRMAIQPSKMIIAFAAVCVICLTGWLMDLKKSVLTSGRATQLQVYVDNYSQMKTFMDISAPRGKFVGVFAALWDFATAKLQNTIEAIFAFNYMQVKNNFFDCFKALAWAFEYHYIYCIIFFTITLAVVSFAGGSISRIAAVEFARNEKPGLGEAVMFTSKRFMSFFTAPLVPFGIIAAVGACVVILGLIGNIPWAGELIIGVSMLPAIMAGAVIALILIGTVAGFSLMFPAVAYDGSDSFDSLSRSFSYIFAKPWRMGFYTIVAAIYGAICYLFVRFFGFLILYSVRSFLAVGIWVKGTQTADKLTAIWPEPSFARLVSAIPMSGNWSEIGGAFFIHIFSLLIVGLLAAFLISFYFSANTIIYALMRNKVDNAALSDVY